MEQSTKIYNIDFNKVAKKSFKDLPKSIQKKVSLQIEKFGTEPRPHKCEKVKNKKYLKTYKVRVADYRIFYEVHDAKSLVIILDIRLRNEDTYDL